MDEGTVLLSEESNEPNDGISEVSDGTPSDEISEEIVSSDENAESEVTENSDQDEQSEPDQNLSDDETTEKPTSTVIQVIENSDSDTGYSISELDVTGLNEFVERQNSLLGVTPSSNDYYDFITGDVLNYFEGVMAMYPLNDYKAVHLRHWIQNTQYYSYYDDYYYLWYDYPNTDCVEIIKYNGQANYVVSRTTQNDLTSNIVYGSAAGQSDFRKGVSYVQEMGLLCAVCVCLVLYILHAIFKHLAR